jgi:hypothetical protein
MRSAGAPYQFVMTGDLCSSKLPRSDAVESIAMIEDLTTFLGEVRAVAVLSPLGYGLKTTAVDAAAAGAYTLAHPTIVRRSPSELAPAMIPVETTRLPAAAEVARILQKLQPRAPLEAIDRQCRMRSLEMLDRDFGDRASAQRNDMQRAEHLLRPQ